MKLWQGILLGVIMGLLLSGVIVLIVRPPLGKPVELIPPPTASPVMVYVVGAVVNPGTYTLPPDSRVRDAIQLAGGLSTDSDITTLNLAAFVQDGQRLWVPYKIITTPSADVCAINGCQNLTPLPPSVDHPLNLNTATEAELEMLPGIGPVKATAIITYRQQNGPFETIEDIQSVPGITGTVFAEIKELITTSDQP